MIQLAQDITNEFSGSTHVHPVGLLMLIVLSAATLVAPRRWAFLPILILACFISPVQRIVVATLDFDFIRILTLVGWMRVFMRGEYRSFRWCLLDYLMIAWAISGLIAYTLLFGTAEALVYKLGTTYTSLGLYYYFRWIVTDWSDFKRVVLAFAIVSLPVAVVFVFEKVTGKNLFSIFGGVAFNTMIREGKLRAQGPFTHPIIAGCFWAAAAPLIASGWWMTGLVKRLAPFSVVCCIIVVIATASSTPMAATAAAILGALFFCLRAQMGWIKLGVVVTLLWLHFVAMKKPVWHLISRIDLAGGSTGYHRYRLIDAAIHHFGDWWAIGTKSTRAWGPQLNDVTNQYILEGVRGGVLTLLLFSLALWAAFHYVGKLWRLVEANNTKLIASWSMGVALFTHSMSFIAVSYFGQISILWYLSLAMPASLLSFERSKHTIEPKSTKEFARTTNRDSTRDRTIPPPPSAHQS